VQPASRSNLWRGRETGATSWPRWAGADTLRALVHRTPIAGPNLTCSAGGVVNPSDVDETVRGTEVVVQLARQEDSDTFFEVSVRGTFSIRRPAGATTSARSVLFGSDAALGSGLPATDSDRRASSPDGVPRILCLSKVMEEGHGRTVFNQYRLPVTVLRSSWVFEGRSAQSFLPCCTT
jgi:nucleoside-diphosphate-sugar epimerase